MGYYFKVDENDIKEAIEGYIPENNRSQLLKKGSNQIILDAYNANPSSMAVAIANFLQLENQNKIMTVSYTHLTLPTIRLTCRSRWWPDH